MGPTPKRDTAASDPAAAEAVARAKQYPFDLPKHSYVLVNGAVVPLRAFDMAAVGDSLVGDDAGPLSLAHWLSAKGRSTAGLSARRHPVLAIGSNVSPEQLARKFRGLGGELVIPVVRARMFDFDVVYSAHFARYGSIPAALQYAPGGVVTVFLNFLTDHQLPIMHASESVGRNYAFARLKSVRVGTFGGESLEELDCYLSEYGCFCYEHQPIGLSAIESAGTLFPRMDEAEVLDLSRRLLAPDKALDPFILENIKDGALRARRTRALARYAQPFAYGEVDVIIGRLKPRRGTTF